MSVFFFFFLWLFIFVVLWQDYLSSVRKDLPYPKTAAVNEIQPLIWVFLPRLGWVYFAILERWLLFQSALPLISQLSKAAKFVLAVFSFWAFSGQVFQLFLSCPVWYPGINTPRHTHTHMLVYPESWAQCCCFHVIRVLKYFFHSNLKEYLAFFDAITIIPVLSKEHFIIISLFLYYCRRFEWGNFSLLW